MKRFRGGPRNSSRGGGFWAGFFKGGGGGGRVQVHGNFHILTSKKSLGGGGKPPTPRIRHCASQSKKKEYRICNPVETSRPGGPEGGFFFRRGNPRKVHLLPNRPPPPPHTHTEVPATGLKPLETPETGYYRIPTYIPTINYLLHGSITLLTEYQSIDLFPSKNTKNAPNKGCIVWNRYSFCAPYAICRFVKHRIVSNL